MQLKMFALVIIFFLLGCDSAKDDIENNLNGNLDKDILLGYCPTMENIAKEIEQKNEGVSLMPFGSTGEAIFGLNAGKIDVVLVGRIVKSHESNAFEKRLRGGLTLVGDKKRFITLNELEKSVVHTALSNDEVEQYLPENTEIVYHTFVNSAIKEGLKEIVLINWADYNDGLELVIPVNNGLEKIEKFRIPVLYSYNESILKNTDI